MSSSQDDVVPVTSGRPLTVIIDGPSGSGKTTMAGEFATRLAANGTVSILHMDDLYAGWHGLDRGIATATELANQRLAGVELRWQKYNWHSQKFDTWQRIPADHIVILEGCGSLVEQAPEIADIRIWLDAPEDVRKERAFSRGGENYESFWEIWSEQFENYVAQTNPQSRANLMLRANL